jgi:uncharacterized protein YebE (UPF0316 family)
MNDKILMQNNELIVFFSIFIIAFPFVIILAVKIIKTLVKKKYVSFIKEHSLAIRQLLQINKSFNFKEIPNYSMSHEYDNENIII